MRIGGDAVLDFVVKGRQAGGERRRRRRGGERGAWGGERKQAQKEGTGIKRRLETDKTRQPVVMALVVLLEGSLLRCTGW